MDGLEVSDELYEDASSSVFLHSELRVDPGQRSIRIDKYLAERMENVSRTFLQQALTAGLVKVSDLVVKSSYRIKPGDIVKLYQHYPPHNSEILPEAIPLDIIYEDEHLLVICKKAGMVVHPGHGHFSGTLVNALLYYLRDCPLFQQGGVRPGLAHRIDKDTSGLLAIGKTELAMRKLSEQFLHKTAYRRYVALVWGQFEADEGTIRGYLARDPSNRQRIKAFSDSTKGKLAVTHWSVLERFSFVTLLSCRLETGRMHQIRAQMQSINHPIFGDEKYGGAQILRGVNTNEYSTFVKSAFSTCPRQALHADLLVLAHPLTGESMQFHAPFPDDFATLLEHWRLFGSSLGVGSN